MCADRLPNRFGAIEDETLVLWSVLGSLEAFDELVRRFRGAVRIIAQQETGTREAAEDVAQEAFVLAFRALPQLEDLSRFPAWLCAITRRRARRIAQQERRSEPCEPTKLDQLVLACSRELAAHPVEALARQSECAEIRASLDRLPADYRAAMQLYYCEEWPVRRIADFLQLPTTTVKWRLHHGRNLLRRELTDAPADQTEENRDG